ncbi:hypothetical protein STEG23_038434, partial [Scotinomys teguina]
GAKDIGAVQKQYDLMFLSASRREQCAEEGGVLRACPLTGVAQLWMAHCSLLSSHKLGQLSGGGDLDLASTFRRLFCSYNKANEIDTHICSSSFREWVPVFRGLASRSALTAGPSPRFPESGVSFPVVSLRTSLMAAGPLPPPHPVPGGPAVCGDTELSAPPACGGQPQAPAPPDPVLETRGFRELQRPDPSFSEVGSEDPPQAGQEEMRGDNNLTLRFHQATGQQPDDSLSESWVMCPENGDPELVSETRFLCVALAVVELTP